MIQALDIYYLIAWPLALMLVILALIRNRWRHFFLAVSLLVGIAWWATVTERQAKHAYMSGTFPKSTTELRDKLGEPEKKVIFTEGDELWTYSVRSYPWSRIQWYTIYGDHILSSSARNEIGLFELEPEYIRDSKEAALTRAILEPLKQPIENEPNK